MLYDFISDELIKNKLIQIKPGTRIEKDDIVEREISINNNIIFKFSGLIRNLTVICAFTETQMKIMFPHEMRKFKLLNLKIKNKKTED